VRRIFWLALGLGAGTTAAIIVSRWARRQAKHLAPASLWNQASTTAKDLAALLGEAVQEFRVAREEKEAEIRASLAE
jgi:hypothetical protein